MGSSLGLGGIFLLFSGVVFMIMLLTLIAKSGQNTTEDEEAAAEHNEEEEINTEDVDKIETVPDSTDPNYENDGSDVLSDVDPTKQFKPSQSLFKRLAKRK